MKHVVRRWIRVLALPAALLGGLSAAPAAIHEISGPEQSIQAAINASAPGDTVLVAPGHYHQRLTIIDRSLTLGSWTLTTGDTLWLDQTILDGDSLGTVLWLAAGPPHRIVVDGFTVQRGFADADAYIGGGVHLDGQLDAELRHLRLRNNRSLPQGAGMCTGGAINARRIVVRHVRTDGNSGIMTSATYALCLRSSQYLEVRDFVFRDSLVNAGTFYSYDTLLVDGVDIRDHQQTNLVFGAIAGNANATSVNICRNVSIRNCSRGLSTTAGFTCQGELHLSKILVEGCVQEGIGDIFNTGLLNLSAVTRLVADSIVVRNNRSAMPLNAGLTFSAPVDLYNPARQMTISHLVVEHNTQGDSTHAPFSTLSFPHLVKLTNAEVRHSVFRNNTIIVAPDPANPDPESGVWDVGFLTCRASRFDSLVFEDIVFQDNRVIDLDNLNTPGGRFPNYGSILKIYAERANLALRDLVFEENTEPRTAGEVVHPTMDPVPNNGNVANVSGGRYSAADWLTVSAENLAFRGNDNGGLIIGGADWVHLRNIRMVDMKRQGLNLSADSFLVEHLLVDGCVPDRALAFRSEQMPLRLDCEAWGLVRNTTVRNSSTPYVVMAGLTDYNEPRVPQVTFENCLFADNQFNRFEAEVRPYDSWYPNWDFFRPGRFDHCLLPVAPQHGDNNLIAVDPVWDGMLGPPYLDALSPLVDAGADNPAWNDNEDPAHPGFALWPSQGTTRADIGVTGGPHAMALDLDWAPVPPPATDAGPAAFTLGDPYPNPFNPVTHIHVTLLRPMPVRLAVHNLLGQQVAVLVDGILPAGTHHLPFHAGRLASGVYLVTLEVAGRAQTRTVTLLR